MHRIESFFLSKRCTKNLYVDTSHVAPRRARTSLACTWKAPRCLSTSSAAWVKEPTWERSVHCGYRPCRLKSSVAALELHHRLYALCSLPRDRCCPILTASDIRVRCRGCFLSRNHNPACDELCGALSVGVALVTSNKTANIVRIFLRVVCARLRIGGLKSRPALP